MPRFSVLPLLLILGLLSACDDQPAPPAGTQAPVDEPSRTTPVTPEKPIAPPEQTPEKLPEPGSKVIEDTSLPKPADSKPKPAAKVSPQEKLPPVRLDLKLPPELVEQLQPDEPPEEAGSPPLLPELFVEKPKEPGPFELNGRLITNEREKDEGYWNSVEGAELQFKFRN